MIKKILKIFRKKKSTNGWYRFASEIESKENRKILERAARLANEDQRKIYYGTTQ